MFVSSVTFWSCHVGFSSITTLNKLPSIFFPAFLYELKPVGRLLQNCCVEPLYFSLTSSCV